MGDDPAGSDDDLNTLFDRVSNKLGWKCDANFDELFEQVGTAAPGLGRRERRAG